MSQLAVVYLDKQEIEMSEQILLRSLAIDPDYRSSLYNLAVIYNHKQQYSNAVKLLTKLVNHYPEHVNGLQLLGDCFMRLHQVEEAERIYKDVLSRHPNHVSALHNLGNLVTVSVYLVCFFSVTAFISLSIDVEIEQNLFCSVSHSLVGLPV